MTAQQIIANRSLRAEFNLYQSAVNYINDCDTPSKWTIVLGDNRTYWVVSNRDAAILVKAGYEYASE